MGAKKFESGGFAVPGTDLLAKYNIPKTSITNPALDVRAYKNKEGRVMYITFFNDKPSIAIPAGYEFAGSAGQFIAETKKADEAKPVVTATGTVEQGGDGGVGTVGGGPSVGTGSGVDGPSGTSIGNSAIGIAIGSIANSIANAMGLSNAPNDAISVSDAVTTTGVSTSANAEGLATSAVASAVDDASISEGVTSSSADAAAAAAASDAADAAAAAADGNSGNTSGDSGDGGDGGGDGSSGDGSGDGSGFAKGGLVAKRKKKPTPAKKRGIASKK
jgi:hypothetical protein